MSQILRRLPGRAVQLIVILAVAAIFLLVGINPFRSSASAKTVAGMQMTHAPAQSSKTVVLKHQHTVHVTIQNLAFKPAHLVVSPGTKIIWTNQDGFQHTTTSNRGLWDSGPVDPGASFVRVFKKAATLTYHCTIHPFMHGTITVTK